ncbi:complement factor H-like isoform X2 [Parambassis ranga]|uniref:Complement factor H-like isoform X2 n=1 Tax=Parambassis ranga TaxID=210632 RepID=A0A6P7IF90_9TELE|nr:complement factor H-like isoform X2 [Parambassis ranga]
MWYCCMTSACISEHTDVSVCRKISGFFRMRFFHPLWFFILWLKVNWSAQQNECTLEQLTSSYLHDKNFNISNLASRYSYGTQVRVPCNVGYTGFFKLICTENGWQSRGRCQLKSCGHPGDADFAEFRLEIGDDFVFGSQVVYTCHKGYVMVSRINYRHCTAHGWDGQIPLCEAQTCSKMMVADHVLVFGDMGEANYGEVLRFSCKDYNHALYGREVIYCNENGEWSHSLPECRGVICSRPQIQHGHVTGDTQVYNKDQYLTFECNDGYQPVEERPSKCSKVGNRAGWIPRPMCEEIKCRVRLIQGTQYGPRYKNVFLPGETLRVTCEEREWISNHQTTSAETTCQDGQWTIDPVCREVTCSRPPDRSLQWWDANRRQQIKLGDSARYSCKPGYKKTSFNTWATCTRDGWKPNPLCKEITCPRKVYPHAEIVGDIQSEYQYNQRVEYACNNGFEGTFTITCRDNGWSPESQQCREVFCDRLAIEDAQISGNDKAKYQHGEGVTYTCADSGEVLNLTCKNGDLTGNKTCPVFPPCERPPGLEDGDTKYLLKSNYSHKEKVEYVCQLYYTMEGDPYRTCINEPCIVDKDDMRQQNILLKSSNTKYFTHDALIEFRCVRGVPMGAALSQRCNNGVFFLPTCQ